jgi:hypothetical protein
MCGVPEESKCVKSPRSGYVFSVRSVSQVCPHGSLLMNAVLLPSLLLVCAADDPSPAPKLPLGKETSYVTGPLDKHGYIDYEAALNAELSRGITPEQNANVLLVRLLGPAPEGAEMPPEFFKWLGIPVPPRDGEYFLGFDSFNRESVRLTPAQLEALGEFQARAAQRVWTAEECVPLAEWLKANEKALVLVHEAVKRPEYFNPLCSRRKEGDSSNLIGALLPTVQRCRELGTALTVRATLRIGQKKFDAAWQDLLACHRLGRLMSRGGTLIEVLVGIAICQRASTATLVYLDRADLTAEQARARLKDLHALPPMAALVDKVALGERMSGLDALQLLRRGDEGGLSILFMDGTTPTAEELKALERINWAPVMQTMNKWYDRQSAALRLKDRGAREREFDKFQEDLNEAPKLFGSNGGLLKQLAAKDGEKVVGAKLGNTLASFLLPASRRVQERFDRNVQVEENLRVAFALAAYRADNNRYPENLADLAPKYLPAVPGDLFSDKALIYKPTEKGYLFYSVGPNGKDDGGRGPNDDPPGDDPGVRMPLPELKKK